MLWCVVNTTPQLSYPEKEIQINPGFMKASRQWPCALMVNAGKNYGTMKKVRW